MANKIFIQNYLTEMKRIAEAMPVADIDQAIEILFEAWADGQQVFTCGNGGSAATASHFACDLAKMTIVADKSRLKASCLNDNIPLMTALINDEGFENLFYEQLKSHLTQGDVLICISVHGGAGSDKAGLWSQNLIKAMIYAREKGGKAIGLAGFDGGPMKAIADTCIVVPANSTLHVESFHLALEHLICARLRQKILESGNYL